MQILTLPQAVREIHKLDPRSAINEPMLKVLVSEKKIPYGSRGNRTIIKLDMVISALNKLLGFEDETELPKIRTIRNAAAETGLSDKYLTVGQSLIRRCVADGVIRVLVIGNRNYVALQSFTEPYIQRIVYGETPQISKREEIKKDMLQQMSDSISSRSAVPPVVRIRTKK